MWLSRHLRHRCGYGVHSPFLYRVVRDVMMPQRVVGGSRELYDELLARGVGRRTARRLQNLVSVVGYRGATIDNVQGEGELGVATINCEERTLRAMAERVATTEGAVCIITPVGHPTRRTLCKELIGGHPSMSASKPSFTLLFSRPDLQKQHIDI